jgi:hypothetical protein
MYLAVKKRKIIVKYCQFKYNYHSDAVKLTPYLYGNIYKQKITELQTSFSLWRTIQNIFIIALFYRQSTTHALYN